MIRINLLNSAVAASNEGAVDPELFEDVSENRGMGGIKLLLFFLGPIALFYYESQVIIPELQSQMRSKRSQLSKLQEKNNKNANIVADIKKYKEELEKVKVQQAYIESINRDRMVEVKILDLIQRELPERMWLSKIEMKDKKIRLEGIAESSAETSSLVDILERSIFLDNMRLEGETDKVLPQATVKEFKLSGVLEVKNEPAN